MRLLFTQLEINCQVEQLWIDSSIPRGFDFQQKISTDFLQVSNAHWIHGEKLMQLNCQRVFLTYSNANDRHNLKYPDLVHFIKNWLESDNQKLEVLRIQFHKENSESAMKRDLEHMKIELKEMFHWLTGKRKKFDPTKEETRYLNCPKMINGNPEAIKTYVNMGRVQLKETKRFNLPMDCDSIKKRILTSGSLKTLKNGIAFVRNIYGMYELQEAFLSISYHSDNVFCYAIDSKSSGRLKSFMRKLSRCLGNVVVLEKEYNFDKAGHYQDRAHFNCLEKILHLNWKHAILLQNFDLIIKTPIQLSELSDILNYTSIMGFDYGRKEKYQNITDWTPRGLKLFKNESSISTSILDKTLNIREYLNQVIVSKMFLKSVFDKIDLTNIIKLFDDKSLYSTDEMLINTIYGNYLGLDGQLESSCVEEYADVLSRFTHWVLTTPGGYEKKCKSKWKRHWICVLGVEYLEDLSRSPYVIANKVIPEFDFGPIICAREMVINNWTGANPDEQYLSRFPQFREMQQKANGSYNKEHFFC